MGNTVRSRIAHDSQLLLAPWHPNFDKDQMECPLRCHERPHTELADVSHELTPRKRAQLRVVLAKEGKDELGVLNYRSRFIIPFGDMYKLDALGRALAEAGREGPYGYGIDFNRFLREAAADPDATVAPTPIYCDLHGQRMELADID